MIKMIVLILGVIGWIVGLVAGWIQVKSYREGKRINAGYQEILERAKQDWEGRYTQEQVQKLTEQFDQLQDTIKKEVPKQAKRVFLEDQLIALSDRIAQLFLKYNAIATEFSEISRPDLLPSSIREEIENTIMPSYLIRQKQHRLTNRLLKSILFVLTVPFFFIFLANVYEADNFFIKDLIFLIVTIILVTFAIGHNYGNKISNQIDQLSLLNGLFVILLGWNISFLFYIYIRYILFYKFYFPNFTSVIFIVLIYIISAIPFSISIIITKKVVFKKS